MKLKLSLINKHVLKVKEDLDFRADQGSQLIQKAEVNLIFGKIVPILSVHQGIVVLLKELVENMQGSAEVPQIVENTETGAELAQIFIDAYEELSQAYPPFLIYHEAIRGLIAAAQERNPDFRVYLMEKERSEEFGRKTFDDLFIRPVQRIPQLLNLLERLEKHTSAMNKQKVKEAIGLLDKMQKRACEAATQNDNFIQELSSYNEVEGLPVNLIV
ncbi:unnamed protein product [Angiostrongylus costaricensis]|uniref:DH domain-containing protein n=1 Tax=Angiostrongylus costaricensis TaxID=334426 RepID=A0A0R3Q0M4_ANGCS|nr:unnamed protein product [Angiostrongylus costaricensis]